MTQNARKSSRPPVARVIPTAYEIICRRPECRETICGPGGSLFWTSAEIAVARRKGERAICLACGNKYSLPQGLP